MQINWESFTTYNHDVRGIRFKFEDLCRQLFANENLSGNKQLKHSAEKTVEYYTGKEGIVDLVFLFCNKPITSTADGYTNAVEI